MIHVDVPSISFVENDYNVGIYLNASTACQTFHGLLTISILPADVITGVSPREAQFRGLVELRSNVHYEIQ